MLATMQHKHTLYALSRTAFTTNLWTYQSKIINNNCDYLNAKYYTCNVRYKDVIKMFTGIQIIRMLMMIVSVVEQSLIVPM